MDSQVEGRRQSVRNIGGGIMQRNRRVSPDLAASLLLLLGFAVLIFADGLALGRLYGSASSGAGEGEPVRPEEGVNLQVPEPVGNKSARNKVILQPKDSIPRPDQEPDCIYMPSPPNVVEAMLKLAEVQPGEVLFDLGSGDGRICIAAAKSWRAHAYGYEIQAGLVKESLENVKKNKLEHLVTIERRNIFKLDLSGADVVTLWLLPALNGKLIPQLEKMKPGSRIVSFDFDMCDIVRPDKVVEVDVPPDNRYWFKNRKSKIYLWKTPLKKDEDRFREWFPRFVDIGK